MRLMQYLLRGVRLFFRQLGKNEPGISKILRITVKSYGVWYLSFRNTYFSFKDEMI